MRELIIFGVALLVGLLLMPLLTYLVGVLMLGPYSTSGRGFGGFLADIFTSLFHGALPVWGMILGPYLLLGLLRACLFVYQRYLSDGT